ncbi:zinc finger CCHC-type and RNA-binding motif-containing protein 1 isoform X2 [Scomber scombrus]|nr:zinc finger CCHC-type and RNA-binding motif-containing protein 1 isoform X2 [Scomber scombrus]
MNIVTMVAPLIFCMVIARTTSIREKAWTTFVFITAAVVVVFWPAKRASPVHCSSCSWSSMSGGLAPSKSTVYVSNLPFSLTNNDLHKLFTKYGKVVKVTIVKDKDTHKSKGVAFVLFLDRDSAHNCARAVNNKQLFGRTVKASIAVDNGRATEFIRRRNYTDKSKCYECGDTGHLSYACPKNMLGEREPPKKKEKKKKKKAQEPEEIEEESEEEGEDPTLDSLSQAIAFQQARIEEEEVKHQTQAVSSQEEDAHASTSSDSRKPRIKKSAYFSDEEELSD